MMYDVYYWNKHEYCWKLLGQIGGHNKRRAIKEAKRHWLDFVQRSDVLKVEEPKNPSVA